jgi:hypothetical protein
MFSVGIRVAAWLLLIAIAIATLAPPQIRPTSGYSATIERFATFATLAAVFWIAYPKHRTSMLVALLGGICLLEWGQSGVVGRHSQLSDVVIKGFGATSGFFISTVLERFSREWRPR